MGLVLLGGCRSPRSLPPREVPPPPPPPAPSQPLAPSSAPQSWLEQLSLPWQGLEQALGSGEGPAQREEVRQALKALSERAALRPGAALVRAMQDWARRPPPAGSSSPIPQWQEEGRSLQGYFSFAPCALELLEAAQEWWQQGAVAQAAFEVQRAALLFQSAPLEVRAAEAQRVTQEATALLEASSVPSLEAKEVEACGRALEAWRRFLLVGWLLEAKAHAFLARGHAQKMAWSDVEREVKACQRFVEQAALLSAQGERWRSSLSPHFEAILAGLREEKAGLPDLLEALEARLERLLGEG